MKNISVHARVQIEGGSTELSTMTDLPFVSAIIPVFNDLDALAYCLRALNRQTYPKACYEVIVVDNGSDKAMSPHKLVSRYPLVRFASEPKPGSYAARNHGVKIARGQIIAFTDADCIPMEDWLEKGVKQMLERPKIGLLSGDIDFFVRHSGPLTAIELYEQAVAFDPKRLLNKKRYGVTANLFTFRSVLDLVGLFDENLKSGADLEWGQRVHAAGFEQVFSAYAQVAHPTRSSFTELYWRTVRIAGGTYDLYVRSKPNWVLRNVYFLMMLIRDVTFIPCAFLYHIGLDCRVHGFRNRFKYACVSVWVRSIEIVEKVRLNFGKPSSRR